VYSDPPLGALTPPLHAHQTPALPYGTKGGGLGGSTRGVEGGSVNPDPPLGALTPPLHAHQTPCPPIGQGGVWVDPRGGSRGGR